MYMCIYIYISLFVVNKHIHTHPGCSSQGPFRRVEPGDSPKVGFSSFVSVDRRVLHGEKNSGKVDGI